MAGLNQSKKNLVLAQKAGGGWDAGERQQKNQHQHGVTGALLHQEMSSRSSPMIWARRRATTTRNAPRFMVYTRSPWPRSETLLTCHSQGHATARKTEPAVSRGTV